MLLLGESRGGAPGALHVALAYQGLSSFRCLPRGGRKEGTRNRLPAASLLLALPLESAAGAPQITGMLSFVFSSDYLRSAEMTEVMMNTPAMDEIGLSPRKDGLSYQVSVLLAAGTLIPCGIAWTRL